MTEAAEVYAEVTRERLATRVELQDEDPITFGERMISRLRQRDAINVDGVDLMFSDDVWDMSSRIAKPRKRDLYILHFERAGRFADIAKLYCLERLVKESTSVDTINGSLRTICRLLSFAEQAGYDDIASMPLPFYEEFRSLSSHVSIAVRNRYDTQVLSFLAFYERSFAPLRDRRVLKLLAKRDKGLFLAEREARKTDEIGKGFLEELLYVCHHVAHNEEEPHDKRVIACCLMMYSQIGCRKGEIATFRTGAISKLDGDGRGPDLWYASFEYSKRKECRWEWTPTTCYLNELALDAFRLLERICAGAREEAGTDALVVFEGGMPFSDSTFQRRYRRFVLDCLSIPPFLNSPDRNRNGMASTTALEAVTASDGWLSRKTEEGIRSALEERGLEEGDLLVYPHIGMFRNTVCTGLYRQRKSLTWIGRHLNHLCVEMEAYYNRADREIDREFSNEVYRSVVTTGARIVGPNGDAFMEKIDAFLKKEGHLSRIEADTETIIGKLCSRYPLKKKRLGMCIRCAAVAACPTDETSDEVTCALGVCPNHCSMGWMSAGTYAELKDAELVVKANLDRGRVKEAQHELAKMRNVLEARFARELTELDRMVSEHGAEALLAEHPEVADIIAHMDEVWREVEAWRSWQL